MMSELDCWMEWIENQMAEEPYDNPTEDDMDDFVGGLVILTLYLICQLFGSSNSAANKSMMH